MLYAPLPRRAFLAQFALALKRGRLKQADTILKKAAESGEVSAASATVRQRGSLIQFASGKANPDTVFLLASITKPMTAAAVMILEGRGQLALADPVRKFIPEFQGGDRGVITIQHLLTHTSGLPDMLPDNDELRKRHAPLKDFVAGACRVPLLFKPGTQCKYQSMGILLAAEIVERVTKTKLRAFLRSEVFQPFGMTQTSLGLGGRSIPSTAQCQIAGNGDWNWNSPYWRDLGAPWGGAHATSGDIVRFLERFLEPKNNVLKPEAARRMVTNHNQGLNEPWGLGFMVNGAKFSAKCSPDTFGHWGSTGTVCWADPATQTAFALLTTKPAAESRGHVLAPVSDAVAEAA